MISEADLRILHQRAGRKGGLQTQLQKKQERLSIYRSKVELAYSHYLHVLMLAGDILSFRYEPIRFNLAPRTSYTPDFLVMLKDGSFEFHETKGWAREDAMVKLKIAARLYPHWTFRLVTRIRGEWKVQEVPR